MPSPMVTPPTGASLQRLAEQSWDRLGAGSVLYYEGTRWTGDQLAERVRRVAGGLVEAGLRAGERVVVCMANCPEVGITYAAVWRAGAVATPVLFLLSEDELRHVISDVGPSRLRRAAAAAVRGAGDRAGRPADRLAPVQPRRAALHRWHDRPVKGRDDQPRRAVGRGVGGHGDVL